MPPPAPPLFQPEAPQMAVSYGEGVLCPMQNDFLGLEYTEGSSVDFATDSLKWQGCAGTWIPFNQT